MNIKEKIYRVCYESFHVLMPASLIAKRVYKMKLGKKLDYKRPVDINEKINWMKFYGDTSLWSDLADKYKVRDFVKKRGCDDTLVSLYAMWKDADDINFDVLPQSFVLKTNHGNGEVLIVKDKSKLDLNETKALFKQYLSEDFGKYQGEPHYRKIQRCIIAEELLDIDDLDYTTSLVDYKIWCFDGKPYYIWACYSRTKDKVYVEVHDLKWNYHPEKSVFTDHYRDGKGIVPKPEKLDEMLKIASKLSEGFPEVRVDLYENKGKIYFGEMTFTSNGGYMDFYTQEFLDELGSYCCLPIDK